MIKSTRRRSEDKGSSWLMTFADLMTLLLTFFILLLSFSNIDAEKYRLIAHSLADSFGVSWIQGSPPRIIEVPVKDSTPLPEPELPMPAEPSQPSTVEPMESWLTRPTPEQTVDPNIDALAGSLIDDLSNDIAADALSVQFDHQKVVVRFSQEATFPLGSAELKPDMDRIIGKVVESLSRCYGDIIVSGYTDDQPISSTRFRSNWDLSAARAVSVVHELLRPGLLDPEHVLAAGHAETRALASNDTEEGRSRNRRVEINIYNPDCRESP